MITSSSHSTTESNHKDNRVIYASGVKDGHFIINSDHPHETDSDSFIQIQSIKAIQGFDGRVVDFYEVYFDDLKQVVNDNIESVSWCDSHGSELKSFSVVRPGKAQFHFTEDGKYDFTLKTPMVVHCEWVGESTKYFDAYDFAYYMDSNPDSDLATFLELQNGGQEKEEDTTKEQAQPEARVDEQKSSEPEKSPEEIAREKVIKGRKGKITSDNPEFYQRLENERNKHVNVDPYFKLKRNTELARFYYAMRDAEKEANASAEASESTTETTSTASSRPSVNERTPEKTTDKETTVKSFFETVHTTIVESFDDLKDYIASSFSRFTGKSKETTTESTVTNNSTAESTTSATSTDRLKTLEESVIRTTSQIEKPVQPGKQTVLQLAYNQKQLLEGWFDQQDKQHKEDEEFIASKVVENKAATQSMLAKVLNGIRDVNQNISKHFNKNKLGEWLRNLLIFVGAVIFWPQIKNFLKSGIDWIANTPIVKALKKWVSAEFPEAYKLIKNVASVLKTIWSGLDTLMSYLNEHKEELYNTITEVGTKVLTWINEEMPTWIQNVEKSIDHVATAIDYITKWLKQTYSTFNDLFGTSDKASSQINESDLYDKYPQHVGMFREAIDMNNRYAERNYPQWTDENTGLTWNIPRLQVDQLFSEGNKDSNTSPFWQGVKDAGAFLGKGVDLIADSTVGALGRQIDGNENWRFRPYSDTTSAADAAGMSSAVRDYAKAKGVSISQLAIPRDAQGYPTKEGLSQLGSSESTIDHMPEYAEMTTSLPTPMNYPTAQPQPKNQTNVVQSSQTSIATTTYNIQNPKSQLR